MFKVIMRVNYLVVQWLGCHAHCQGTQVQSLVGELISCKLCGVAKTKDKK